MRGLFPRENADVRIIKSLRSQDLPEGEFFFKLPLREKTRDEVKMYEKQCWRNVEISV